MDTNKKLSLHQNIDKLKLGGLSTQSPATDQEEANCLTAISPLAYLADLLDYATRRIKKGEEWITLADLENYFHQPFGQIPLTCEAVDEEVAQIRISIEILRSHLADQTSAEEFRTAERSYLRLTYESILLKLKLSPTTLASIAEASSATRADLAGRLGIDESHLNQLWIAEEDLTETWLEEVFGVKDTKTSPFSKVESNFLLWQKQHLEDLADRLFDEAGEKKSTWLTTRKNQVTDRLKRIIQAVEEETLPLLRRGLLPDTKAARQMGNELLINCEYDACFRTTRVSQAISTLQQLITSTRNGTLQDTHPELSLVAPQFSEEWKWLSTYQSWRSAMMVFLYPENVLDPALRNTSTTVLQRIIRDIRKERILNRKKAEAYQQLYQEYYEEILGLRVHASCFCDNQLYLGATSNGKAFFSSIVNNSQDQWSRIPGLDDKYVYHILSVFAQKSHGSSSRILVLLLTVQRDAKGDFVGNEYHLYLQQFEVASGDWQEEAVPLDLPGKIVFGPYQEADSPEDRVIVEQTYELERYTSPSLLFRNEGAYFLNQVNEDGSGWQNENWVKWNGPQNQLPEKIYGLFRIGKNLTVACYGRSLNLFKQTYFGQLIFAGTNNFKIEFKSGWVNEKLDRLKVAFHYERSPTINEAGPTLWCFVQNDQETHSALYQILAEANGNSFQKISGPINLSEAYHFSSHNGNAYIYSLPINQTEVIRIPASKVIQSEGSRLWHQFDAYFYKRQHEVSQSGDLTVPLRYPAYAAYDLQPKDHLLNYWWEVEYFLPIYLAQQLSRSHQYFDAKDYFRLVYDHQLPLSNRKKFYGLVEEGGLEADLSRAANWLSDPLNPHAIASLRRNAYTAYTIMSIVKCLLQEADHAFATDTIESLAVARNGYLQVVDLLHRWDDSGQDEDQGLAPSTTLSTSSLQVLLQERAGTHLAQEQKEQDYSFSPYVDSLLNINVYAFKIPENLLWQYLEAHAEINLFKLNTCRNIAGEERPPAPISIQGLNVQDFLSASARGVHAPTHTTTLQPTLYRFSFLIDRAKQLNSIAQQLETTFLGLLEKLDAEQFSLLNAKSEMQLARAGVRLQDIRLVEAQNNEQLADLQIGRSLVQQRRYESLIYMGLNHWEAAALDAQLVAMTLLAGSAATDTLKAIFSFGLFGDPVGKAAQAAQAIASYSSAQASFERRRSEWEYQKRVAEVDVRIGQQQKNIASDRTKITNQERNIAILRSDHAETITQFLTNKFTSAELYDWMSEILEGVYSYFLQQATATAQLAAQQLNFERQEPVPAFILSNYWEAPRDQLTQKEGEERDRRGLTGSVRLLQDIHQLEQFALQTDRRKLQLTKTISLARLSPVEFQQFRQTGKMLFYTLMELFDRDFPGQYLRLIKRVRVSVIALAPAIDGIKATLSNHGISRVVQPLLSSFDTTVVRRMPESIALTGSMNASGVFDFEPADQNKLRPFESTGVDTAWEFSLPKAANVSLDYNSIADVLITIDYTALHSEDYKRQVIVQLDKTFSADRAFSFRNEFPDQWYDLNHPELLAEADQMQVQFETLATDFAPNLEALQIKHLVFYFVNDDGLPPMAVTVGFNDFTALNRMAYDGILSSRQGENIERWQSFFTETSPIGNWSLSLPNNDTVKDWFASKQIKDIVFVVTYEGRISWD